MSDYDGAILVVGIVGVAIAAYSIFGKGGATDQAAAAGSWFAKNVINPANVTATTNLASVAVTKTAAQLQGNGAYYLSNVPATPQGNSPSNWVWTLPDGMTVGLPAGTTPAQFAAQNPNSPISAKIKEIDVAAGASNVAKWLASVISDTGLAW
jgi:hypothetical protein